jgi:hypothetical protein
MNESKNEWNGFEASKRALEDAYQSVLESDLLPVGDTTKVAVNERRIGLEEERFLLAVCGQMKAGKSTLLNALVFGEPVLPHDDTVMTAKNTLIQHGPSPAIDVTFYDQREWQDLTHQMKTSEPEAWIEFERDEIGEAIRQGHYPDEWCRSPRKTKHCDGTDDLYKYVTPVRKGGQLSPYVKSVTVTHPAHWLKHVTVADTPGVNDPLAFRENITKKWIQNAGALLYVSYAGQAMSKPDIKFLDDHLLHVPSRKRIIAFNKVDTVAEGQKTVDDYIQRLANSSDPAVKAVFGRKGSIRYVSGLGGLIAEMERSGVELTEELEAYREMLAGSGHLEDANHGLPKLRQLIEERLLSASGRDLIASHQEFILSLFERQSRFILKAREEIEDQLELLAADADELKSRQERIQTQLQYAHEQLTELKQRMHKLRKHSGERIEYTIDTAAKRISQTVKTKLDMTSSIDDLSRDAVWIIKDSIEEQRRTIRDSLSAEERDLKTKAQAEFSRVAVELGEEGISCKANFELGTYELSKELKKAISDSIQADDLKRLINDVTNWFKRVFNTSRGRKDARAELYGWVRKWTEEHLAKELLINLEIKLSDATNIQIETIQSEVNQRLDAQRQLAEQLLQTDATRTIQVSTFEEEISKLEREQEAVASLRLQVEEIMNGAAS